MKTHVNRTIHFPSQRAVRRALALALFTMAGAQASAAGLFLAPRGVRPMSRGGSFVAGADDVNALSYNPAGLSEAGDGVLLDLALPLHSTQYRRSLYAGGPTFAKVEGEGMGMPIPTLGATFSFLGLSDMRFGVGLAADVPLLQNWPEEPDAPQRYAIESYKGTALSKLTAGLSYDVNDMLTVGMTGQLLFGSFAAQSTISNCDGFICTRPERPAYDAKVKMVSEGIVTPGLQAGVLVKPLPWLRFGVAYETGYDIDNDVELQVRLPTAPAYSAAELGPATPKGRIQMQLPPQLRMGVEGRIADIARLELSYVYERWSVHDKITVEPRDVVIRNLPAPLGDYDMSAMVIDRNFEDTWSVRLGSEIKTPTGLLPTPVTTRLGLMYEPSAIPDEALTAMSVDLDKLLLALGASVSLFDDALQLDATYGYVFMVSRDITTSAILQSNPTRPAPADRTPIGNGTYSAGAHLLGVGVSYRL